MEVGRHADPNASAGARAGRRRLHPIVAGLALTLGGQVAVALCTVLLYRLIVERLGTEGFGAFSLGKQAVSLLFPVVTVGLVGGLPRAMALTRAGRGPAPEALLGAALAICGTVALACALLAVALPGATSAAFFGGTADAQLVAAAAVLLVATALFHVAYGYFRGRLRLGAANLLQVLASGVAPVLLLLAVPDVGVDGLLASMGVVLGVLSLAWIGGPVVRAARAGRRALTTAGRGLLDYGARRVPGEIAQVGLFALVPVVASHVTGLTEVGFLAAALQLVAMLGVALNPIGVVLLPSFAERFEADPAGMRRQAGALAGFALHAAAFAAAQLLVFGGLVLEIWLGPEFEAAGSLARVTLLAAGPFVFYLVMRSSLDAVAVRSYNTRSNLAGLTTFAAIATVGLASDALDPAFAVAWAFAGGVTVQGAMTAVFVQRRFSVPTGDYAALPALALAALSGGAALALRPAIEGSGAPLVLLIAAEAVLSVLFLAGLLAVRAPWTGLLRTRILRGGG